MTTIAWDGKTLASDSRRTRAGKDKEEIHRNDWAVKFVLYPLSKGEPMVYKKDPIRAIAMAGSVELSRGALDMLTEMGSACFEVFHKNLEISRNYRNGIYVMLMVGERYTHKIYVSSGRFKYLQTEIDKPMSIGTGDSIAMFMMLHFGLNAQEAVAAAMIESDSSGGFVHSALFAENGIVENPRIYHSDRNVVRTMIQQRISEFKVSDQPDPFLDAIFLTHPKPKPKEESVAVEIPPAPVTPAKKAVRKKPKLASKVPVRKSKKRK